MARLTFNPWLNFTHSEEVYHHIVPTQIKYRNRFNEIENQISNKKCDTIKIKGGKNIKLVTEGNKKNKTIIINVELSSKYNEKSRHVDEENTPVSGESLDEVTKKLFDAISQNGDILDGERIKFNVGSTTFTM